MHHTQVSWAFLQTKQADSLPEKKGVIQKQHSLILKMIYDS